MSAEALYESFDKELRKSLGDVPTVLRGLEAHARAMRARIAELDTSLLDAQQTHNRAATGALQERLVTDLRAARAQAEQRLADVVTALETLRLDLLRLHAGAGSAESITQDLASARALGSDVDRLLAGGREVERMLGR
jgi:eukaryotic-like serine/threonine-protein kinase